MSLQLMAWIAGSVLAAGALTFVVVAVLPSKHPDPHDGMARGCLFLAAIGLLALAGIAAAGAVWNVGFLVKSVFTLVVGIGLLLAAQGVFLLVRGGRRR